MFWIKFSIVFFPLNLLTFPTETLTGFSSYFKVMLLNQMMQLHPLLLSSKRLKKKKKPILWDLTNTSTSSDTDPVSCTVPTALKVHSSWILVLASNQELAPAVLAPNFLNSFLFFPLVLREMENRKFIRSSHKCLSTMSA